MKGLTAALGQREERLRAGGTRKQTRLICDRTAADCSDQHALEVRRSGSRREQEGVWASEASRGMK